MSTEIDVLVPGRPSCDIVFSGLASWPVVGREIYADGLAVSAGAHFNTAAALARLDLRVALVAVVGADPWGELVLRDLRAEGLTDEFVRTTPRVPTSVSVVLNQQGDRGFVTYGPDHDRAEEEFVALALEVLESRPVRHVHGDLSHATPPILAAARGARATFSVDAHEAGDWLVEPRVHELVAAADVVFANEDEALAMTGAADWEGAARELGARSAHVVLKRGREGAAAVVGGDLLVAPTTPVAVVDATGAGDCFVAGYLWGHLRGEPASTCLALGNLCGGAAVGQAGGFAAAPRRLELLEAARSAGVPVA